ncbi:hypothetical protein HYC85_021124 [Camellia sinensis]|uniref:Uncharacterized protein n=1 Tax=Camellia sinensis TaxID=4442 RepID=A0A7J7GHI4_CAMSI|nr:hypothetical protein HYC85_021124 [Camellia sinensis]
MKMRNKGKVYPSPSSSSSSMCFYTANRDALSVLKLLPTAILALVSILSVQDREVFAYMITRSIKSSNPSSILEEKKKSNKKSNTHKPPIFDCDCFDCYTSYWFRWDSSPNRELIHQAIEAFEEHLSSGEKREKNGRGKRKEKMGRRGNESREVKREVVLPEVMEVVPEKGGEEEEEKEDEVVAPPEDAAVMRRSVAENNNHKGLVRKVLPDVVGILNSRLWSLWSPNV